MEIILLLIIIIISIGFNIFMIIKQTEKINEPKKVERKPKLTKAEEEKQKKIKESFENLMNYDETTARKRK